MFRGEISHADEGLKGVKSFEISWNLITKLSAPLGSSHAMPELPEQTHREHPIEERAVTHRERISAFGDHRDTL
jgi:hypothetical protein